MCTWVPQYTYGEQRTVLSSHLVGPRVVRPADQLLYPSSNLFGPRILRAWNESKAESGRCATVVQSDIHDRFKITD